MRDVYVYLEYDPEPFIFNGAEFRSSWPDADSLKQAVDDAVQAVVRADEGFIEVARDTWIKASRITSVLISGDGPDRGQSHGSE